jgi:leucyl-tRNA synthetase
MPTKGRSKRTALADERIVRFIDGKPVKKVITVKNKLVNIVT